MKLKRPKVVYSGKKPVEVILDLAAYQELLERAQDLNDLKVLARLRKHPPSYVPLEDVLDDLASKKKPR